MNQPETVRKLRGRTLLVIDDTESIRRRVIEFLRSHDVFDNFLEASDGISGFSLLRDHKDSIDLILCDLEMPGIDGFRFLHMKDSRGDEYTEIPVIMLTARAEVDKKVQGLELGASDYLIKPVDEGELLARVRVQLRLKSLQDQLRRLSNTDVLTGLFNRRHIMDVLQNEFARALRYEEVVSFVLIDIDHFKSVNDTLGHQVGDDVLRHAALLFQEGLRDGDFIGRYGGEEFALVLPHTDLDGATAAAERYRKLIEGAAAPHGKPLTISLGVSSSTLAPVKSTDDLIRTADEALYAAKHQGRNRVVRFDQLAL